jgi:hypothetical protein
MGGRDTPSVSKYLAPASSEGTARIQFKKGVHILNRNKEHYETNRRHLGHQKRGGVTNITDTKHSRAARKQGAVCYLLQASTDDKNRVSNGT